MDNNRQNVYVTSECAIIHVEPEESLTNQNAVAGNDQIQVDIMETVYQVMSRSNEAALAMAASGQKIQVFHCLSET